MMRRRLRCALTGHRFAPYLAVYGNAPAGIVRICTRCGAVR